MRLLPEALQQPHAATEYFELLETLVRRLPALPAIDADGGADGSATTQSAASALPPPAANLKGEGAGGSRRTGGERGTALQSTAASSDGTNVLEQDRLRLCRAALAQALPSNGEGSIPGGSGSGSALASLTRSGGMSCGRDERLVLGLLRLLGALAATSGGCLRLLGACVPELVDRYLVRLAKAAEEADEGGGGARRRRRQRGRRRMERVGGGGSVSSSAAAVAGSGGSGVGVGVGVGGQPPDSVRHACLAMLLSTCRHPPNLRALLPCLERTHVRHAHAEWGITPSGELRCRTPVWSTRARRAT